MPVRVPPVVAVALALVASVAAPQAAIPLQDDAGSGQDAPENPGNALLLDGPGLYEGNLTTPADADWFRLASAGGQGYCLESEVGGPAGADVTVADNLTLNRTVSRTHDPVHGLDLGLATEANGTLLLGLEPLETPTDQPAAGLGNYHLNVTRAPVDQVGDDPGSGSDAPGSGDLPRVPDACFRGHLGASGGAGAQDDVDAYNFTGELGETVTLSLTDNRPDATVFLNLTDPDGDQVLSLSDGGPASTTLNKTGNYTVALETPDTKDQISYGVGLTLGDDDDDDDDSGSCRPGCFPFAPR